MKKLLVVIVLTVGLWGFTPGCAQCQLVSINEPHDPMIGDYNPHTLAWFQWTQIGYRLVGYSRHVNTPVFTTHACALSGGQPLEPR